MREKCLKITNKSNHRVPRKYEVDAYEPPVFAPDYSATDLAAKICTYSQMSILCISHFYAFFTLETLYG
jgi:hypothetical protein